MDIDVEIDIEAAYALTLFELQNLGRLINERELEIDRAQEVLNRLINNLIIRTKQFNEEWEENRCYMDFIPDGVESSTE
jgi:uncharacterized coiled-coil protein SlyX